MNIEKYKVLNGVVASMWEICFTDEFPAARDSHP